jgi:ribose transport system permease protein
MSAAETPPAAEAAAPERRRRLTAANLVWLWPLLAAAIVFFVTIGWSGGRGAGDILVSAVTFSALFVIVGLGQTLVITAGPGNIDLSIPAAISLSGAIAMKVMDESNALIPLGLALALLAGVALGFVNYGLIRLLRIPPIIATMSTSLLTQSIAIAYGRGLKIKPPPLFAEFSTGRVLGVPTLAIVAAVLTALILLVLSRTVYGRTLLALGQNLRAARLAGTPVALARLVTYVLSATLACLCGALLAGFSGGSSLDSGEEYLLASIAVTIIGGTNVAGGRAEPLGVWGAALLLFLLVTMLNSFGVSAGVRLLVTGLVIIGVIAASGGRRSS